MKRIRSVSAALGLLVVVAGCAHPQAQAKEQPSAIAREQQAAESQYGAALNAQKHAQEEEGKAEAAAKDVESAQRALADAEARAHAQEFKARQAQQEAANAGDAAAQRGKEAQGRALTEQRNALQNRELALQPLAQRREVLGRVVDSSGGGVRVALPDSREVYLKIDDATAILLDGKPVPVTELSPGDDVRASYDLIHNNATAVRIEATSAESAPK